MIQIPEIVNCTICTIHGVARQADVAITFLDGIEKGGPVPRTTFLCDEHQMEVAGKLVQQVMT